MINSAYIVYFADECSWSSDNVYFLKKEAAEKYIDDKVEKYSLSFLTEATWKGFSISHKWLDSVLVKLQAEIDVLEKEVESFDCQNPNALFVLERKRISLEGHKNAYERHLHLKKMSDSFEFWKEEKMKSYRKEWIVSEIFFADAEYV